MQTRTLYDIFDRAMENYYYTIRKDNNKVELTGTVYIEGLDEEVHYKKTYELTYEDNPTTMERRICSFKDEFKKIIAEKLKDHLDVLVDDTKMIKSLRDQIRKMKEEHEALRDENESLKREINRLLEEKGREEVLRNIPVYPDPFTNPVNPGYPINPSTAPWPPYGPIITCSENTDDVK